MPSLGAVSIGRDFRLAVIGDVRSPPTVHRPKRPPRKKVQAAAITGPAIVTARSERTHRQVADVVASDEPAAIITAKNPHRRGRLGDVPDMTPEEHKHRGDAADALFRELVRRGAGNKA